MSASMLGGTLPQSETTLQDLLAPWLPQGYARIVQPIASTAISTDTKGLVAGEVKIQTQAATRSATSKRVHTLRNDQTVRRPSQRAMTFMTHCRGYA